MDPIALEFSLDCSPEHAFDVWTCRATMSTAKGSGTKEDPWVLETPPGTSEYQMWRDEEADPPALVCQVGKTQLRYQLRCIEDLHAMLKAVGDWVPLGAADEQKTSAEGTVEAWVVRPTTRSVAGTA